MWRSTPWRGGVGRCLRSRGTRPNRKTCAATDRPPPSRERRRLLERSCLLAARSSMTRTSTERCSREVVELVFFAHTSRSCGSFCCSSCGRLRGCRTGVPAVTVELAHEPGGRSVRRLSYETRWASRPPSRRALRLGAAGGITRALRCGTCRRDRRVLPSPGRDVGSWLTGDRMATVVHRGGEGSRRVRQPKAYASRCGSATARPAQGSSRGDPDMTRLVAYRAGRVVGRTSRLDRWSVASPTPQRGTSLSPSSPALRACLPAGVRVPRAL